LKAALKRGALVAAANWPVALVQATADALFKLVVAVPLVGGVVLVTIVIGADTDSLITADWRVMAASVVSLLLTHRLVLVAFLLSLTVAIVGGSMFVVLVKGGSVAVLVKGDRQAGAIETPPLHLEMIAGAGAFSVERFIESARALFPRYARLGVALTGIYLVSGLLFTSLMLGWPSLPGWWVTTLATPLFVGWITLVNFVYLLIQVVIAADDCGIRAAVRRVVLFLRRDARLVLGAFGVTLALMVLATIASILAFVAIGLIFFIPLVSLAAIPLQLIAVVLRAIVFQYISLAAVGAYLKLYRERSLAGETSAGVQVADGLVHAASGPDAPRF
jgi:hypothetical protein